VSRIERNVRVPHGAGPRRGTIACGGTRVAATAASRGSKSHTAPGAARQRPTDRARCRRGAA
jgi:hypothetical protein